MILYRSSSFGLVLVCVLAAAHDSRADDTDTVTRAREEFMRGAALVKNAQWAEALLEFEHSAQDRPHSVTTYNIGACERAMGRYTLARETFLKARAQNDASGGAEMAQGLVVEMNGYIDEIQRLLAEATLTIDPAEASVAVDGRPLAPSASATGVLVAGLRPPGPPERAPKGSFTVLLDPGAHLFTISRAGFSDSLVNRTLAPGETVSLKLELNRLPAMFHIVSDPPGAATSIEGVDVGATPVDLSRPAGKYVIGVKKSGYVSYESTVNAQPGESANVLAKLPLEKPSVVQRWWFWTTIGAVLAGGVVATYFIVRSQAQPQQPALNGGGLNWNIPVP